MSPECAKNLGMVLVGSLSREAEGIRHLKKALELDPKVPGAEKVRHVIGTSTRRMNDE